MYRIEKYVLSPPQNKCYFHKHSLNIWCQNDKLISYFVKIDDCNLISQYPHPSLRVKDRLYYVFIIGLRSRKNLL